MQICSVLPNTYLPTVCVLLLFKCENKELNLNTIQLDSMNNTIGDIPGIKGSVLVLSVSRATCDILQLCGILLQSCVEVIY